jgi:putative phosphoribosyl transferase
MTSLVRLKPLKTPQALIADACLPVPRTLFADRVDAGKELAAAVKRELGERAISERPLVLAIPRGGVTIGLEVAMALNAEFDLVIPRKIGAEGNPEYAIGAVMHDGTAFLNPEAVALTGASADYIQAEKTKEMHEAVRRLEAYRAGRKEPALSDRVVVVVDDGIATGATMTAALRWLRSRGAKMVVAAAPVAPASTVTELRQEADLVTCPQSPEPFHAIGEFYEDFGQVSDEDVKEMLKGYWSRA